ncbi:MAG: cytochrome c family protein [Burkholderiales bacterium]|nr:MAG: cytochrome c family protein [Burkholderiales bacterium]TAG81593.1 MAG: cytochrome c family protein [Betaproteobacteria bacterium]
MFAQTTVEAKTSGDAKRGEEAYARLCIGCHSIDQNRIGPKHRGVVGRRVGGVADFKYSDALTQSKLTWDGALLDRWLENPEATIKGQRMGFRVTTPATRADIIEYLTTQKASK